VSCTYVREINQVGEMSVDWMKILKWSSEELDIIVRTQEILLHQPEVGGRSCPRNLVLFHFSLILKQQKMDDIHEANDLSGNIWRRIGSICGVIRS